MLGCATSGEGEYPSSTISDSLDTQDHKAAQDFAGLVCNPGVMVNAQAGVDFATIRQIDTAHCGIVAHLVIKIGQFSLIMLEFGHGHRII